MIQLIKTILDDNGKSLSLVISIFSLLISFINLYKNRRRIHISANFKYNFIFNKIIDIDKPVSVANEQSLVGPIDKGCEYYLIEVVIANNSPHPITLENIQITDENGKYFDLVSEFQLFNSNNALLPKNLGVLRSYVTEDEPFKVVETFTPFKERPIALPAFGTSFNTHAVYISKENPNIPEYFYVICNTTIPRNKFSKCWYRFRDWCVKKLKLKNVDSKNPEFKVIIKKSSRSPHNRDVFR